MMGNIFAIAAKDIRIELRTKAAVFQVIPFVLAASLLFAFGLDVNTPTLTLAAPGVFWVVVLFASMQLIGQSAENEKLDGVNDALRLSGIASIELFLGKSVALFVQILFVEIVCGLVMWTMYGLDVSGPITVILTLLFVAVDVALLGAVYGPIAVGSGRIQAILPVLFLPAVAPVLLCATRSFQVVFDQAAGNSSQWIAMLGILGVIYGMIGGVTSGSLFNEL